MLLALLYPVVLGAALRVEGDGRCPDPAQVAADVQKIVDISPDYAPRVHATLQREGAWLELTLTDADGNSLGERRFDGSEDCALLGHAAAVVLAAWLSDQHPEYVVSLPTGATPPMADAPEPAGASATREAETPRLPAPAPPPAVTPAVPPRPTPATREQSAPPKHRAALIAALGGAWGSAEFAPAAWLGVSLDPGTRGWGFDLTAAWVANRSEPLSTHEVRWARWPLLVGPYLRLPTKQGRLDLEAGPAFGWLRLQGQNFSPDIARAHSAFGSYAALRFMPNAGAWQPFLMVAPVFWFGRATAVVTSPNGAETTAALPSLDLLFAAGVRFLP